MAQRFPRLRGTHCINNNDEPNERNTKFIKVVETIIGEKTDESVVDIKDNGNNSNSNSSNSNSNTSDSDIVVMNNDEKLCSYY